MKLRWDYLLDNIGTKKEVAVLKDEEGIIVLKVFQDMYCHVTEPNYEKFNFLEPKKIFFGKEKYLVQKQYRKDFASFSPEQLAEKELLYACELIKEDFDIQLSSKPIIRS